MIQEAIQYIGLHTLCLTLPFNCDSWYTKRWLHQFHSVLWLLSYCIKAIRCKIATGSHVARASCLWNREICRTHWLWSVRQEFYKERGGGGDRFLGSVQTLSLLRDLSKAGVESSTATGILFCDLSLNFENAYLCSVFIETVYRTGQNESLIYR